MNKYTKKPIGAQGRTPPRQPRQRTPASRAERVASGLITFDHAPEGDFTVVAGLHRAQAAQSLGLPLRARDVNSGQEFVISRPRLAGRETIRRQQYMAYDTEVNADGSPHSLHIAMEMDYGQIEARVMATIRDEVHRALEVSVPVLRIDSIPEGTGRTAVQVETASFERLQESIRALTDSFRSMGVSAGGAASSFNTLARYLRSSGDVAAERETRERNRAEEFARMYGAGPVRIANNFAIQGMSRVMLQGLLRPDRNAGIVMMDTEGSFNRDYMDAMAFGVNYGTADPDAKVTIEKLKERPEPHPDAGKVVAQARRIKRTLTGFDVEDVRLPDGGVLRTSTPGGYTMVRIFNRRKS